MVAERQFRSDLFYRLKVFPIVSPPLRDRQEDIAPLVRYFTQKFATRMNKRIDAIPTETMTALARYHWPGNIRELENFIERAVDPIARFDTRRAALRIEAAAQIRHRSRAPGALNVGGS